jgi:hypothetical protein
VVFLVSCTSGVVREETERQRTNLSRAILDSFTNHYTINIFPFKNLTGDPDLDYLTNAIPDMLESHLKPIESETCFIPFDMLSFDMNSNIESLVEVSNTIFTNYLIHLPAMYTQYNEQITTDGLLTVVVTNTNNTNTNAYTNQGQLNLPAGTLPPLISTNTYTNIITNRTISNIIQTNLAKLVMDNYIYLIFNEYTNITDTICYMPIDINRTNDIQIKIPVSNQSQSNILSLSKTVITNTNLSNTNIAVTNLSNAVVSNIIPNYYSIIRGNYKLFEKRVGPNVLMINIAVTNVINNTNTIFLSNTAREDKLPERVFDFIKPLRKAYLNRETGDILIDTQPEETSIYYDSTFIGKSPLYYPAIPSGRHLFSILEEGYPRVTLQADIVADKTNIILKSIEHLTTGGTVQINSQPANALVFLDSTYVGNTPLTLTNLIIDKVHRISIETKETNYYPFYNTFTLHSTNQIYQIDAHLLGSQGTPDWQKRLLWWGVYAGWGVTLWFVGLNIYADYEKQINLDLYYNNNNNTFALMQADNYSSLYQTTTTWGVISALGTLGLTAFALLNEEVYLGLESNPSTTYACVSFRF